MKKRFAEWCTRCILQELGNGKDVDSIDIQLNMSILKLLHAQWIIDLYDCLKSSEREITSNGWKAAFIKEALIKGTKGLDPLNPLALIDPLSEEVDSINFAVVLNTEVDSFFVSKNDDDDDSEDDDDDDTWVDENEEPINNIFDLMDDIQLYINCENINI